VLDGKSISGATPTRVIVAATPLRVTSDVTPTRSAVSIGARRFASGATPVRNYSIIGIGVLADTGIYLELASGGFLQLNLGTNLKLN
jgi:hypothetical protein